MQSVSFLGKSISRLIVGDNPFNGYSYIPDQITGEEMKGFYTEEMWQKSLFEAEANGYTCMLPLATPFVIDRLAEYKKNGGKMDFIFQSFAAMDQVESMKLMAKVEPIGVYHQGNLTDRLYLAGDGASIARQVKEYKETLGISVGVGSHIPECILKAEEEEWGADFYLCCMQNAFKHEREEGEERYLGPNTRAEYLFYPGDRRKMLDVIAGTDKPCIAYKIFAGGQMFDSKSPEQIAKAIKDTYKEVFSAIKPQDAAAIGVFQKYGNQLKQDADLFNEAMKELNDPE